MATFCALAHPKNEQKLPLKFARTFVQTISFVLYPANPPTTTLKRWPSRRQQKALKAGREAHIEVLSSFLLFILLTCTVLS